MPESCNATAAAIATAPYLLRFICIPAGLRAIFRVLLPVESSPKERTEEEREREEGVREIDGR